MNENSGAHAATSSMPRRDALKAMAAAAVVPMLPDQREGGTVDGAFEAAVTEATRAPLPVLAPPPAKGPRGTPSDPVLINAKATWPKKLMPRELLTLTALCDMIIPADDKSPAASTVGAPDFINEWASRPGGDASLIRVRGGLVWIDRECVTRFGTRFHLATNAQRTAICDDICFIAKAKPGYVFGAQFFDTIRDQTATAFYTTPQGWKDIGYIGNVPLQKFTGPSAAIRKQIGVD